MTPLHTLPAGARFQLAAIPERTGTLLRVGEGSAVVRYDGTRHVEVGGRSFEAQSGALTISRETQVVALPTPEDAP